MTLKFEKVIIPHSSISRLILEGWADHYVNQPFWYCVSQITVKDLCFFTQIPKMNICTYVLYRKILCDPLDTLCPHYPSRVNP